MSGGQQTQKRCCPLPPSPVSASVSLSSYRVGYLTSRPLTLKRGTKPERRLHTSATKPNQTSRPTIKARLDNQLRQLDVTSLSQNSPKQPCWFFLQIFYKLWFIYHQQHTDPPPFILPQRISRRDSGLNKESKQKQFCAAEPPSAKMTKIKR